MLYPVHTDPNLLTTRKDAAENTATPDPGHEWAHPEVTRLLASRATALLARRCCPRNTYGITPEQVYSEAMVAILRRRDDVEVYDPEGYVQSRLAFAYMTLRRHAATDARHRSFHRLPDDVEGNGHHGADADRRHVDQHAIGPEQLLVQREYVRTLQVAVTRRIGELGRGEETRARALSTLLTLLAIAANDGCLPEVVPERSDRLERGEVDLLAATWMADPRLRSAGDGPDSPAIRQRRRRLVELVRSEARELLADSTVETVPAEKEAMTWAH